MVSLTKKTVLAALICSLVAQPAQAIGLLKLSSVGAWLSTIMYTLLNKSPLTIAGATHSAATGAVVGTLAHLINKAKDFSEEVAAALVLDYTKKNLQVAHVQYKRDPTPSNLQTLRTAIIYFIKIKKRILRKGTRTEYAEPTENAVKIFETREALADCVKGKGALGWIGSIPKIITIICKKLDGIDEEDTYNENA